MTADKISGQNMQPGAKDLPEEVYQEDHRDALATKRKRIPEGLNRAESLVDGIQDWFDHWDEEHPSIKHIERLEWGNDLGGIELLEELYRNGELNAEQSARFVVVLKKLQDARPLMEQMNISLPDFWEKSK